MTEHNEDPTRRFLDQTVPKDDSWVGREPEEGPARPRHVVLPPAPAPVEDPRQHGGALRSAGWTFGPTLGLLGASALLGGGDDGGQAEFTRAVPGTPAGRPAEAGAEPVMFTDDMPDDLSGGVGEIGSGL